MPSGVHFLSCRDVAAQLVRSAGVGPDDLVMEFGAGQGALTAPLAATGARVVAVERDSGFVRALNRRFAGRHNVRVVLGDLREVPLPRRRYRVVANVPFAVSTALLRRMLQPAGGRLAGADLLLEWGMAARLCRTRPHDLRTAWWAVRFDLRLRRRVPARCFTPPPRVDAAHLVIRDRGLSGRAQRAAWALLAARLRRAGPAGAPHRSAVGGGRLRHRRRGDRGTGAGGAVGRAGQGAGRRPVPVVARAAAPATPPVTCPGRRGGRVAGERGKFCCGAAAGSGTIDVRLHRRRRGGGPVTMTVRRRDDVARVAACAAVPGETGP